MSTDDQATDVASLYREVDRAEWAALAPGVPNPLTETEVVQLRGIGRTIITRDQAGHEDASQQGFSQPNGCASTGCLFNWARIFCHNVGGVNVK